MKFDIKDEFLQSVKMSDKELKQEIAILLFERNLSFKEDIKELTLEEASNLAEVNVVDFKRLIVIKNIRTLIKQFNYSQGRFTSKSYNDSKNKSIDFFPLNWYDTQICSVNGEILSTYIYFKFEYTEELDIKIKIGPGKNQDIRERIDKLLLKELENSDFVQTRLLSPKWTMRYKRPILQNSDYKDDINKIMKKTQDVWQDFITKDFVAIERMVASNKKYIINGNSII
jgi:predicted HTH domain antitoxin